MIGFLGILMKPRALTKRIRQVTHLAVLRDSIFLEWTCRASKAESTARMERAYAEVLRAIIEGLLKAHDEDQDRGLKPRPKDLHVRQKRLSTSGKIQTPKSPRLSSEASSARIYQAF